MEVPLPEALERFVRERVEAGLYRDAGEVVRDALRRMLRDEADGRTRLEALRRDIEIGWQQAERGEFADYSLEAMNAELDGEMDREGRG